MGTRVKESERKKRVNLKVEREREREREPESLLAHNDLQHQSDPVET